VAEIDSLFSNATPIPARVTGSDTVIYSGTASLFAALE